MCSNRFMQHVLYLWWSRVSSCLGLIFSAQCPLVQFTALEAPLSFIIVDRTVYADKDHTPEQAVRNIFGRQRAPAKVCLLFAGSVFLPSTASLSSVKILLPSGELSPGSSMVMSSWALSRLSRNATGSQFSRSGSLARCWSQQWPLAMQRSWRILRFALLYRKMITLISGRGSCWIIQT